MYLKDLDGAKPVTYRCVIERCPNDCGGAEMDEIDYAAFCPNCDQRVDSIYRDKFCGNCGTKLFWGTTAPQFQEDSEEKELPEEDHHDHAGRT